MRNILVYEKIYIFVSKIFKVRETNHVKKKLTAS